MAGRQKVQDDLLLFRMDLDAGERCENKKEIAICVSGVALVLEVSPE